MKASPRPQFILPHVYRNIAWTFLGVTILFVLAVLYLTVTNARIVVTVKTQVFPIEFFVKVRTDYRSPAVNEESSLQGRFVERPGDRKATFEPSATKEEPGQAGGIVTIANTGTAAQPLVARTRFLSSNGVLFRLQKNTVVPAGGSVQAQVLADEKGMKGEVPAERFTIPGLSQELQKKIYGETSAPMTGGIKKIFSLTAEDVNRAKEELGRQLESELRASFEQERAQGEQLIMHHEVLSASVDESLGSKADHFNLRLQSRILGIFVDQQKLLELSRKKLGESVPQGESFGDIQAEDLAVTFVQRYPEKEEQAVQLKVTLTGRRAPTRTSPLFDRSQFAGKKKQEVFETLRKFPNVENVDIELSPFWLRRLPRIVDHITVEVKKQ